MRLRLLIHIQLTCLCLKEKEPLNDGLGSESEPIPCKQDNHIGIIINYQCARIIPRLQGGEPGNEAPVYLTLLSLILGVAFSCGILAYKTAIVFRQVYE